MKLLAHLVLSLAVFSLSISIANAAEAEKGKSTSGKAKAGSAKAKSNAYPLYGVVTAVTTKTLTIKGGEGKEDRKFAIASTTRIHNDGKPATLEDIKPGKKVGGSVERAAAGATGYDKLIAINVGVEQGGKPKAKAKTEGSDNKGKSKAKAE